MAEDLEEFLRRGQDRLRVPRTRGERVREALRRVDWEGWFERGFLLIMAAAVLSSGVASALALWGLATGRLR